MEQDAEPEQAELEQDAEPEQAESAEPEQAESEQDAEPEQAAESDDDASTTSSVQKVNPVREIVKDVLQTPKKRKYLPFTPEKNRIYTLEELNLLSRENVRRIGTAKDLAHMVKYKKGEVIDLILKKQEGKLDELGHVLKQKR